MLRQSALTRLTVENLMTNPPATGRYEKLKCEFIRILTDIDNVRVKKSVESEEMGDRKPSRFYQHFKKLASPSTPDGLILTLWWNRLPTRIRRTLAAIDETNPEKLMRQADLLIEEFGEDHQRTARITTVIDPPAQNVGTNELLASLNALKDDMNQIKARMSALSFNQSPRRRSRAKRHSRSKSREGSQNPDLRYYHLTYRNRARKCQSPCKWTQGNNGISWQLTFKRPSSAWTF